VASILLQPLGSCGNGLPHTAAMETAKYYGLMFANRLPPALLDLRDPTSHRPVAMLTSRTDRSGQQTDPTVL